MFYESSLIRSGHGTSCVSPVTKALAWLASLGTQATYIGPHHLQGGHVEHLEAFEVPPGRLAMSDAPIVTCKVRYSSVVSSLSAFVMFYHTLVLRGQPLMVDFWQPETPEEYITVPPICNKFVEVRPPATCSRHLHQHMLALHQKTSASHVALDQ